MSLAVTLARRELRGGLGGFRLFLACLTIGVAAIAGVGSLARAIHDGIENESRAMLGGDVALRAAHRDIAPELKAVLAKDGTLSRAVTMRTMAARDGAPRRALAELKAVDGAYPLYGRLALDPQMTPDAALGLHDGMWGAVAEPNLFDRLGAKIGDKVKIGNEVFVLRAKIVREPDLAGGASGFPLGPRLMISTQALDATGLVRLGSLIYYHDRLRLPPGTDAPAFAEHLRAAYPDAVWTVRSSDRAAPEVQRLVARTMQFLALVGLTTLLVGGVGIGNAVRAYLAGKTATIATLKCLGASSGLVFRVYLLQVLAMAAIGIVAGIVLGALLPFAAAQVISPALPIAVATELAVRPLAIAALFGVVATIAFSVWPIARACRIAPASLFRDLVAPSGRTPGAAAIAAMAICAAALAALAIWDATDRRLAIWFVTGAVVALGAFGVASIAIRQGARRIRPRRAMLRLAFANLGRPGAPTGSVVLSLGLGLTVLVMVALIEGNIARLAQDTLPEDAPGYFFIDIQPGERAGFTEAVRNAAPGVTLNEVPMLRGRITRVNGRPASELQSETGGRWVISSDRGVSWSATPPENSPVMVGDWWPADYKGPPLVSFDARAAQSLGIGVGDTLTVDVLGREITARIASLRAIDWRSLGINFVLIFSPNALAGAPATTIATLRGPAAAEDAAARAVAARFPNVTAIRVRDVLDAVTGIVERVADAVRMATAATILAGALVLAGALAAGHRRRVYDAVVLKAVGATRGDITRSFLIEHLAIGLIAAAVAAVLGTYAARFAIERVMHFDWVFLPWPVVATALLAAIVCIGLGFVGTWRALGQPAAPLLRNE